MALVKTAVGMHILVDCATTLAPIPQWIASSGGGCARASAWKKSEKGPGERRGDIPDVAVDAGDAKAAALDAKPASIDSVAATAAAEATVASEPSAVAASHTQAAPETTAQDASTSRPEGGDGGQVVAPKKYSNLLALMDNVSASSGSDSDDDSAGGSECDAAADADGNAMEAAATLQEPAATSQEPAASLEQPATTPREAPGTSQNEETATAAADRKEQPAEAMAAQKEAWRKQWEVSKQKEAAGIAANRIWVRAAARAVAEEEQARVRQEAEAAAAAAAESAKAAAAEAAEADRVARAASVLVQQCEELKRVALETAEAVKTAQRAAAADGFMARLEEAVKKTTMCTELGHKLETEAKTSHEAAGTNATAKNLQTASQAVQKVRAAASAVSEAVKAATDSLQAKMVEEEKERQVVAKRRALKEAKLDEERKAKEEAAEKARLAVAAKLGQLAEEANKAKPPPSTKIRKRGRKAEPAEQPSVPEQEDVNKAQRRDAAAEAGEKPPAEAASEGLESRAGEEAADKSPRQQEAVGKSPRTEEAAEKPPPKRAKQGAAGPAAEPPPPHGHEAGTSGGAGPSGAPEGAFVFKAKPAEVQSLPRLMRRGSRPTAAERARAAAAPAATADRTTAAAADRARTAAASNAALEDDLHSKGVADHLVLLDNLGCLSKFTVERELRAHFPTGRLLWASVDIDRRRHMRSVAGWAVLSFKSKKEASEAHAKLKTMYWEAKEWPIPRPIIARTASWTEFPWMDVKRQGDKSDVHKPKPDLPGHVHRTTVEGRGKTMAAHFVQDNTFEFSLAIVWRTLHQQAQELKKDVRKEQLRQMTSLLEKIDKRLHDHDAAAFDACLESAKAALSGLPPERGQAECLMLWLSNVSPKVKEQTIQSAFAQFGECSVHIPSHPVSTQPFGHALVRFVEADEGTAREKARQVVDDINNKLFIIGGSPRPVEAQMCMPGGPRGFQAVFDDAQAEVWGLPRAPTSTKARLVSRSLPTGEATTTPEAILTACAMAVRALLEQQAMEAACLRQEKNFRLAKLHNEHTGTIGQAVSCYDSLKEVFGRRIMKEYAANVCGFTVQGIASKPNRAKSMRQ